MAPSMLVITDQAKKPPNSKSTVNVPTMIGRLADHVRLSLAVTSGIAVDFIGAIAVGRASVTSTGCGVVSAVSAALAGVWASGAAPGASFCGTVMSHLRGQHFARFPCGS